MDFESIASIVFLVLFAIILYVHRKKLTIQKILWPVLYLGMYKTKFGLQFMDNFAKKYPKTLKILGYIGIVVGFLGMGIIAFSLIQNLYMILVKPEAVPGVGLVLPFKVKGVFYVPFFYWIISIFLLALVHEFSHGIIARLYNLKIKSSGFAFLSVFIPIIPAAFVEPDEKEVAKRKASQQLSMFAAGPFSNILFAIVILIISLLVITPLSNAMVDSNGVKITGFIEKEKNNGQLYPAEEAGIVVGERIIGIDGYEIKDLDNFTLVMKDKKPGENITLITNISSYQITLAKNPEDESKAYLGVYVSQSNELNKGFVERFGKITTAVLVWIFGLFYWLFVLNLGIGLFNLVPLGPVDGGRMLLTALQKFFSKERAMKLWGQISFFFLALILANLVFAFIR